MWVVDYCTIVIFSSVSARKILRIFNYEINVDTWGSYNIFWIVTCKLTSLWHYTLQVVYSSCHFIFLWNTLIMHCLHLEIIDMCMQINQMVIGWNLIHSFIFCYKNRENDLNCSHCIKPSFLIARLFSYILFKVFLHITGSLNFLLSLIKEGSSRLESFMKEEDIESDLHIDFPCWLEGGSYLLVANPNIILHLPLLDRGFIRYDDFPYVGVSLSLHEPSKCRSRFLFLFLPQNSFWLLFMKQYKSCTCLIEVEVWLKLKTSWKVGFS